MTVSSSAARADPAPNVGDRSCRRRNLQIRLLFLKSAPTSRSAGPSNYRHRSRCGSAAPPSLRTHRRLGGPWPTRHRETVNDGVQPREEEPELADCSPPRGKVWHTPPAATAGPSSELVRPSIAWLVVESHPSFPWRIYASRCTNVRRGPEGIMWPRSQLAAPIEPGQGTQSGLYAQQLRGVMQATVAVDDDGIDARQRVD